MASCTENREVVITGMGTVSPIGTGNEAYAASLQAGRSGIDTISLFDASHFATTFAGEADGFDPALLLQGEDVLGRTNERRVLLACGAARLAVDDAGLSADSFRPQQSAVLMGTGVHPAIPDMATLMDCGIYTGMFNDPDPDPGKFAQAIEKETSGENRFYPIANRANAGTLAIARQHGIAGPCYSIISACAAATQAIGQGFRMIQRGEIDIALCGGYDSMVFNFGVYAFCLLGLMSTCNENPAGAMKPFDKNRDGFALGEGAGVLIFEERRQAEKRGAHIYARVAGYGASVDAYKVTDPHPEGRGAVIAMRAALRDAGMAPGQVDYINAHGTATPKNDRIETKAIRDVFGSHADTLAVSSTKSMIGHLMAAGGALELIATVLGMEHGFVPPTINYETPDSSCDLDYVPNRSRSAEVRSALSNSFGLGGQNASVIVTKEMPKI
ncbi:MAG: beta-ketoacyl-[acyl-carrier-protein] synthase family protein [Deltaproteobacteria bacterium]|nr:beta-ketoacyl-[acyl-carrier-protein] synthase family protein [Deltaproteobacteria bacterium]